MITPRAIEAFDAFATAAARAALGEATQVDPIPALPEPPPTGDGRAVVMSICDYAFRALTFLHFDDDAATRALVCAADGADPAQLDARAFEDRICETANLLSGAINRELARTFPDVGMSTPLTVMRGAAARLERLRPSHVGHFRLGTEAGAALALTVCICAFAHVDFERPPADATQACGELEMF